MLRKISFSVLAFSLLISTAFANCLPRAEMLRKLKGTKYGEDIFATGKAGKELLVEFLVNADTGTFTVLVTRVMSRNGGKVAGRTCIIAGGSNFQFQEPQPSADPARHTMLKFYQLQ